MNLKQENLQTSQEKSHFTIDQEDVKTGGAERKAVIVLFLTMCPTDHELLR